MKAPTDQEREAAWNFEFYDDGIEATPAEEVKCECWFNREGELIYVVDGCPVHLATN